MPVETATPEQVGRCVDGLLTRIGQLEAENTELEELLHKRAKYAAGLRAEINTSRRWARLWKRAAKQWRVKALWPDDPLMWLPTLQEPTE